MSKTNQLPANTNTPKKHTVPDHLVVPRQVYRIVLDAGRTQPTGREMETLEKIVSLDAILRTEEELLRPRLKMIKNGWRDYKMMQTVFDKLVENILDTCTVRSLEKLKYTAKNCKIHIKPQAVVPIDHCVVVHESALKDLINLVCNAECSICLKNASEVKGCKLRKTLMDVAPLNDPPTNGRCGYLDMMLDGGLDNESE